MHYLSSHHSRSICICVYIIIFIWYLFGVYVVFKYENTFSRVNGNQSRLTILPTKVSGCIQRLTTQTTKLMTACTSTLILVPSDLICGRYIHTKI